MKIGISLLRRDASLTYCVWINQLTLKFDPWDRWSNTIICLIDFIQTLKNAAQNWELKKISETIIK
jgi:hypothetical protein